MNNFAVRSWWNRVTKIRNAMDQTRSFNEAMATAMEQAVTELYDDACSPWFDNRSFKEAL